MSLKESSLNKYLSFKLLSPVKYKKNKYSRTALFKNTNFMFFKHFIFLNFVYKNRYDSIINYFYLNSMLKYNYFNIEKFLYFFYDKNLVIKTINKLNNVYSFNFYLYIYHLNNFYKKWKIIEFYFLPNKLWLNKNFLLKSLNFVNFITLKKNLFWLVKNSFFLTNFFLLEVFKINLDWSDFFYIDSYCLFIENFLKNSGNDDYNFKLFLSKNKSFWFNFYKFIKTIPNGYTSYRSFLNVSFFLTRSMLRQYNIPNSGLNFLILKNLNMLFFWAGDLTKDLKLEQYFVWNWWNFIYRLGIPYKTIYYENFRNCLFYNTMFWPKKTIKGSYYFFPEKLKKIENHFNNHFLNDYPIIKIKKKK